MEAPDDLISLPRAAEIAGLSVHTVRAQARARRLQVRRVGHERLTTRRWLHEYLIRASENDRGTRAPLPEGYLPPDHEDAGP